MKKSILTFAVIASVSVSAAGADSPAERIAAICAGKAQPKSANNTELLRLLNKVQNDFALQDRRVADPNGLVAELDAVIAQSEFASILKCRDRLAKTKGFTYELRFQDPAKGNQSMDVNFAEDQDNDGSKILHVALDLNLTKSVQRVFFVYLHELTHVCQSFETKKVFDRVEDAWSSLTKDQQTEYEKLRVSKADDVRPDFKIVDSAVGDSSRNRFLDEIEAFYNMQLAFRSLIEVSPRLCQGEGTSSSERADSPLFQAYLQTEKDLAEGTFAQSIISGYLEDGQDEERFVYDPPFDSTANKAWGSDGKYRPLNKSMADAVLRFHIPVSGKAQ